MAIRCVAGLGNPGRRYEWTRHNAGFWVVDLVAEGAGLSWRPAIGSLETVVPLGGRRIVLLKPMAFMNRSGEAISACLDRHRVSPEELLVVVDDVAIPESRLRLRRSGGAGGHRGLESIERSTGTRSYPRLRVGVGAGQLDEDLTEFVLNEIPDGERVRFREIAERGADAVRDAVCHGLEWAMNRVNPSPDRSDDVGADPTDTADRWKKE